MNSKDEQRIQAGFISAPFFASCSLAIKTASVSPRSVRNAFKYVSSDRPDVFGSRPFRSVTFSV